MPISKGKLLGLLFKKIYQSQSCLGCLIKCYAKQRCWRCSRYGQKTVDHTGLALFELSMVLKTLTPALSVNALKNPPTPQPLSRHCACVQACVRLYIWQSELCPTMCVRACVHVLVSVCGIFLLHATCIFLVFFLVARGCAVNSSRLPTSPGQ